MGLNCWQNLSCNWKTLQEDINEKKIFDNIERTYVPRINWISICFNRMLRLGFLFWRRKIFQWKLLKQKFFNKSNTKRFEYFFNKFWWYPGRMGCLGKVRLSQATFLAQRVGIFYIPGVLNPNICEGHIWTTKGLRAVKREENVSAGHKRGWAS